MADSGQVDTNLVSAAGIQAQSQQGDRYGLLVSSQDRVPRACHPTISTNGHQCWVAVGSSDGRVHHSPLFRDPAIGKTQIRATHRAVCKLLAQGVESFDSARHGHEAAGALIETVNHPGANRVATALLGQEPNFGIPCENSGNQSSLTLTGTGMNNLVGELVDHQKIGKLRHHVNVHR